MNWFSDALRWYGVLLAVSLAAAPWTLVLFRRLPDRGATIVRPLGLLAVIYPSWLLASLDIVDYTTIGLWVTLGLLLASGWLYVGSQRLINLDWLSKLAIVEVISVAAFFAYIWLHGFTPEIMVTEKPMDEALLSASTIASQMPPNDPWLSGHSINYYYLGYVVHGAVTRMADIVTSVGFTFALATTVSMTIAATSGVAFNAVRRSFSRKAAITVSGLSVFFLAIGGNLYAAKEFLSDPRGTIDAGWWQGIGWNASRVVYDTGGGTESRIQTINEFPIFSFILADLHPHVMALPFTIASLALALNLLFLRSESTHFNLRSPLTIITLLVSGAVIGSLYALNSWDLPTYLLLALAALVAGLHRNSLKLKLSSGGILVFSAFAAWLPFTATFVPLIDRDTIEVRSGLEDIPIVSWLVTTLGSVKWDRTSIGEFLTIFGIPYIACLFLLGFAMIDPNHRLDIRYPRFAFGALFVITVLALLIPMPLLIVCGVPLAICVLILASTVATSPLSLAVAAFALGFAIILTTEFFYIQDVFHNRMNTLFKAYYQVWTLFAIAGSVAIVYLWRDIRLPQIVKPAIGILTVAAVALAAVYPVLSARAWTEEFADWKGVDGAAFIGEWSPGELAAIEWLREHASDKDVVLEQLGCQYQPNAGVPRLSRVSTFTGVPTIIGWAGTEGQWRTGQAEIKNSLSEREDDVQVMYLDPQSELLDEYGVTYIYVGKYELEAASEISTPGSCEKGIAYSNVAEPTFPGPGWDEVFNQDGVKIFHRAETN